LKAPQKDERLLLVGQTGSGKTQAGLFHLSRADFHIRPWVILDYKREKMFKRIEAQEIKLTDNAPKEPGLYVIRPLPDDFEGVDAFLWRIYNHEKTGLFIDESSMLAPQGTWSRPMKAILTQGRSKLIQVIACTQRPVGIDRSFFSESEKMQLFFLSQEPDVKRVQANVRDYEPEALEEFHSFWHEVKGRGTKTIRLAPVPGDKDILAVFRKRARRRRAIL
jgi:hypothetical protein